MAIDLFRKYLQSVVLDSRYKDFYIKYPLNLFWAGENLVEMRKFISSSSSTLDLVRAADKTFMFSVNEASESNRQAVNWLLNFQYSKGYNIFEEVASVQESMCSHPENNIIVNGRQLNPDVLRCYYVAKQISKYCHTSTQPMRRVVEIGAGTGHLARMMNLLVDIDQYVIIDIPETLAFSFAFLKENFPDFEIHLYDPDTSKKDSMSTAKFILVPAPYALLFPVVDYDLFINTASLGEMRVESIRLWMDLIQKKFNVKFLYSLNRYLNSIKLPDHVWRLSENECAVLYDEAWNILSWELEPEFTRCPYVDTQIARYVEIIAERSKIPFDVNDLIAERYELDAQDWFRFVNKDNTMTLLDTQTNHDYTMSGTLYRLWNAIRVSKGLASWPLEYMLMYLSYINKSKNYYEEQFYYMYIYESLFLNEGGERSRFSEGIAKRFLGAANTVSESKKSKSLVCKFLCQLARCSDSLNSLPPVLVADLGEKNCVFYDGYFYSIPKSLGSVSLERMTCAQLKRIPRHYSFRLGSNQTVFSG